MEAKRLMDLPPGAMDDTLLPWWQRKHKNTAPTRKPNARQLQGMLLSREQVCALL